MIRKSTRIGLAAVLISLFLHLLGLAGLTGGERAVQGTAPQETDVVALDDSFENLADPADEATPPEEAPVPEPPVETPAEAEEITTSEALVASNNPVESFAPDTAAVSEVEPGVAPSQDEETNQRPETQATGPVTTEDATPAVEPTPQSSVTIAEAETLAPAGQVQDALSPAETQAVEPVKDEDSEPVDPAESQTPEPESSETVAVPSETVQLGPETSDLVTAVVTSLRPRLPERRPDAARVAPTVQGSLEAPARRIESPLTAYRRDGTDLTLRGGGGRLSGGLGFEGSGGAGNSDQTNYAGRVLVHLNRAPVVPVSGRGAARVLFVINPDGSLASVDVFDTTGSTDIDRAAKEQIRIAAPFPLPPGGKRRSLSFIYRVN